MSRHTIAFENRPTIDGRVIERGALTWGEDPIPLLVSVAEDHRGSLLLGQVTNIARHPDVTDEIRGDLSHPIRGLGPEVDLDATDFEEGPYGLMVVKHGRIRAVTLGANPAWTRLVIR